MSIYNLGKNRMLCWDDFLIDKSANTEIRQHKPIKKNVVLEGTKIWEGNALEYASLIKVNGKYRFLLSRTRRSFRNFTRWQLV